jgi:hypothetical protein
MRHLAMRHVAKRTLVRRFGSASPGLRSPSTLEGRASPPTPVCHHRLWCRPGPEGLMASRDAGFLETHCRFHDFDDLLLARPPRGLHPGTPVGFLFGLQGLSPDLAGPCVAAPSSLVTFTLRLHACRPAPIAGGRVDRSHRSVRLQGSSPGRIRRRRRRTRSSHGSRSCAPLARVAVGVRSPRDLRDSFRVSLLLSRPRRGRPSHDLSRSAFGGPALACSAPTCGPLGPRSASWQHSQTGRCARHPSWSSCLDELSYRALIEC